MALFRRNQTTTTDTADNSVPVDLQQYYSSGSSGIFKWILRIVLFLAVLALLVWAGIWLFNKLTKDDAPVNNPTAVTSQTETQKKQAAADQKTSQAQADAKKAADAAAAKAKAAQEKAAADAKKAQEEANKKIAEAQREANGGTATAPATTTPAPAAKTPAPTTSIALPNTGPETTLAAMLFGIAAVLGTVFHSLVLRRR